MPAWGALGDGNATVEGTKPRVYGPLFGERGHSAGAPSITFVSQASLDAGIQKRAHGYRQLPTVRNTRTVGKKHMLFNDATSPLRVHQVTTK
jgi:urease subunit alpha